MEGDASFTKTIRERATDSLHDHKLILALDAGGTSTRCLVARSDGTVLGRGRGGAGNHILSGWDSARAAISAAVAAACTRAGVELAAVACAFAGSAGVGPNGEGREVVEALLAEILPNACTHATGDMVTAFAGAFDSPVGVVVAAGTGSVCYGCAASGDSRQVGGWGHIMGDEGSAYDIAVRALRAGARATDGRAAETLLTHRLAAALGASNLIEAALRIYAEPMAREAIAALATTVAETAALGDAVACQLLSDAGGELGLLAVTALRALDLADAAVPVAHTGAVFAAGDAVVGSFQQTVAAACPRARVVGAEFPPVVGAFKRALGELDLPFTPVVSAMLRSTMGAEQA